MAAQMKRTNSRSDSAIVGQRKARTVRTWRIRSPETPIPVLVERVPVVEVRYEAAIVGDGWGFWGLVFLCVVGV